MSDPLEACRGCFWAAELTRHDAEVWCSHARFNGWQRTAPGCQGEGFRANLEAERTTR